MILGARVFFSGYGGCWKRGRLGLGIELRVEGAGWLWFSYIVWPGFVSEAEGVLI
jgi:hypothetical protein